MKNINIYDFLIYFFTFYDFVNYLTINNPHRPNYVGITVIFVISAIYFVKINLKYP